MVQQAQQPESVASTLSPYTRLQICDAYLSALDYDEVCPKAQRAFIAGWRNASVGSEANGAAANYLARHALADLRAIRAADELPESIEQIAAILWPESAG